MCGPRQSPRIHRIILFIIILVATVSVAAAAALIWAFVQVVEMI